MKRNAIFISAINFYQRKISPHTARSCRYTPSCSEFARDSYEQYNFIKASYLSIKRIISCNPVGGYGYDPVPMKKHDDD